MESKTTAKNMRISAKKLRFLLPEIKKLNPVKSLDYLLYTPNKSARIFYKVIKSALNNAKQVLKVDENNLRFKHLSVEEGRKLKRFRPGGRGTVKSILRRSAHIKIVLAAETSQAKKDTVSAKLEVKKSKKRGSESTS